jgi:hypothetical protein
LRERYKIPNEISNVTAIRVLRLRGKFARELSTSLKDDSERGS